MTQLTSRPGGLELAGPLTLREVGPLEGQVASALRQLAGQDVRVDLSAVSDLDTAGAVFLRRLPALAGESGARLTLSGLPERLQGFLDVIPAAPAPAAVRPRSALLEALGGQIHRFHREMVDFTFLASDLTWAAIAALVRRRGIRRGSFVEQAVAIGVDGLPIIALILFLIGIVSSLQSAAQLRKFGADIFVADLLGIGITRELGPLMTAIIVSGRSGSAIAAEVATMKFTEELDALRTMALDPLRFVAVPKMWAMILCVPALTVMANLIGILGGIVVGITFIGIPPLAFATQIADALVLKDVVTGLVKSVSFAWIITIIGVFRGLQFTGGADGVGRATTASVVTSIFGIILLDSFWGIVFYLR
jgi:phospholipid/cholesterol/gamma-HCH transport system permease protein